MHFSFSKALQLICFLENHFKRLQPPVQRQFCTIIKSHEACNRMHVGQLSRLISPGWFRETGQVRNTITTFPSISISSLHQKVTRSLRTVFLRLPFVSFVPFFFFLFLVLCCIMRTCRLDGSKIDKVSNGGQFDQFEEFPISPATDKSFFPCELLFFQNSKSNTFAILFSKMFPISIDLPEIPINRQEDERLNFAFFES